MSRRRRHPNPRTVDRTHQELTLLDVIGAEKAALKLAHAADDTTDIPTAPATSTTTATQQVEE